MSSPDHHQSIPESFFGSLEIGSPGRIAIFFGCAAAALTVALLPRVASDLEPAASRALFIMTFAGLLWVTEAIPAYAVGILVIGLQIALLGHPEGVFATRPGDWEQFVGVMGHPLVWLFFGGFVLASGMAQTGVDRRAAVALLGRLGDRPGNLLLGVMAITFVLSMFISNTATTAMMLALLAPVLASIDADDPFGKGLMLGLAVAANLGGMGSLIGTPPNAIAVGALAELATPVHISFLQWMAIGLPPALFLLVIMWLLIRWSYPARQQRLELSGFEQGDDAPSVPRWERLVVTATLLLTVGLWLTSQWHGIPTAAVSFVPIVLLTTTGILGTKQIRELPYDVLFLLAGGLALGQMVTATGLSTWLVGLLPIETLSITALVVVIAYATVVLSNFMSNTGAANILVPIGITMAAGHEPRVAVAIALAASCAMCLPIATPPNALVFSTGRCETRDFIRLGLVIGALAPIVVVIWTAWAL
jgi:sodium-dependent dicarboxylate transporter 2/3/5